MTLLGWDLLALLGITISFLIVTLIFMLSYMFNSEFLKSWSKEEFFNVFMTLILFGTFMSMVKLPMFTSNINEASDYVGNLFNGILKIQLSMISDVSALSLISSLSFSINPTAIAAMSKGDGGKQETKSDSEKSAPDNPLNSLSVSFSMAPFFSPFLTAMSSLQTYSFVPITMIKLHQLLIDFVKSDAARTIPILLTAGILLRAFKFSRNAGNTILALFLSLYFVLPVIYLFNQAVVTEVIGIDSGGQGHFDNEGKGFVTNLINLMTNQIKQGSMTEILLEDDGCKGSIGCSIYNMVSPANTKDDNKFNDKNGSIYNVVIIFFIEGLILPYLSIIIALGIAREFAMTLGSNVDFSSLVRLV